jgi:hypothetical protein
MLVYGFISPLLRKFSFCQNTNTFFFLHRHAYVFISEGLCMFVYEGVSKSFRTESITKYMLTTINSRREATQRVMAAKLTRVTHKIAIQLHLMAESCTIEFFAPGGQSGNFWIHPRIYAYKRTHIKKPK